MGHLRRSEGRCREALRGADSATILLVGFLLLAGPAQASPIVLLGDSWGVLAGPSIESTLAANGHGALGVTNASVGGSTAAQWSGGTYDVAGLFAAHPDAVVAHLIVGGNDLIGGVLGGGNPITVISQTVSATTSVLTQIASSSSAEILFSGYDYVPNPPAGSTPALANLLIDLFLDGVAQNVAADPLLASRVTVVDTHGLMQVAFGIPQLGIAPGDPSLPDATLSGPDAAFADSIHLTPAGYDVYADALYGAFYASVLPEPGVATFGVVVLAAWVVHRRRVAAAL